MGLTEQQKRRVESVFQEALNLPREQRSDYLARVCPDDDFVRQEAASLLGHYESAGELRALGAPQDGPGLDPPVPERIGPYEVLSRLGRGGMGVVYLARDPRLGRKVAIKILSPAIDGTSGAMDRLRREALTASALNHPNILTVYEFGEAEGEQYIVSEYVEGTSLRELIGTLSPKQALDYAQQIGNALAAAHKAGIIHRDIKPENIMVRPDGYVKVLDFGLAKASMHSSALGVTLPARLAQGTADTMPGVLIGTINYMSPEQIQCKPLDQRTDIYSWGVVLYEMLKGKRPFLSAVSESAVSDPDNVDELRGLDARLKLLLRKAMAFSCSDRYATMADALADLRKIQLKNGDQLKQESAVGFYFSRSSRKWKWALVVAALLAAVFTARILVPPRDAPVAIGEQAKLTNAGNVLQAEMSPDGDYMAYAIGDSKSQEMRLMQKQTHAETVKLAPIQGTITGITFAGGFIYYVLLQEGLGTLYRVPLLGSEVRTITSDVDSQVNFSPDFSRFVFLRASGPRTSLVIYNMQTGEEKILAKLEAPRHFQSTPLWSPDGSFVISESWNDTSQEMKFISIRVSDGRESTIGTGPWVSLRKPAWIGPHSLIVAASGRSMSRFRLVQVLLPSGETREVMGNLTDYLDVSTALQQKEMAVVQRERYTSLWITPLTGTGETRKLTQTGLPFYGLTWTRAGKLISQSETAGRPDLVAVNAGSGEMQSLTEDDSVKIFPEASPDGKYIVYGSNRDGTFHLWRADANGQHPIRLTSDTYGEEEGVFTPDSRWVIFTSLRNGYRSLWKVPIEGGKSVPVTNVNSDKPSVSPDGTLIACEYLDQTANLLRIAILETGSGKLVRFLPNIPTGLARVRWTADGKNLLYAVISQGVGNVWSQPVNGGIARQMTHFVEDQVFSIATDPDGKLLACLRGKNVSDAVVVRLRP